jgi:hypothetical protein
MFKTYDVVKILFILFIVGWIPCLALADGNRTPFAGDMWEVLAYVDVLFAIVCFVYLWTAQPKDR